METQTTEKTNSMPNFNWTKKDRQILKFKDQKEIIGKFMGTRIRLVTEVNDETGERTEKELTDLLLSTVDGKDVAVAIDKGLQIALSSADVDINTDKPKPVWLRMIRGPQKSLGGAKKVNQYEIFVAPVQ